MGVLDIKLSEDAIQKQIVAWLDRVLPPTAIVHHSRNEGNRGGKKGLVDGAQGKAMGVMPGFPDLLIYVDGFGCCIEVKKIGAKQSAIQKTVEEKLALHGIPYAVCRSVEDVRAALNKWGIRTREKSQ